MVRGWDTLIDLRPGHCYLLQIESAPEEPYEQRGTEEETPSPTNTHTQKPIGGMVDRQAETTKALYSFAGAVITKYHTLGCLNNSLLSQIWRLQVQNQGVRRAGSSDGYERRSCSRSLSLACKWQSSCSPGILSMYLSVPRFPLLMRTSYWSWTHSNDLTFLDYLCDDPISKGHMMRYWESELQQIFFGGTQFNS